MGPGAGSSTREPPGAYEHIRADKIAELLPCPQLCPHATAQGAPSPRLAPSDQHPH